MSFLSSFLSRFLGLVSGWLALWCAVGGITAYFVPDAFAWLGTRILGEPLFKWLFAITMFGVGTVVDAAAFKGLARRPAPVAVGLAAQFSIMPLLAWLAVRVLALDGDIALGFILVGCVPGAMTSNVLTYLARGDTAYSVTLTTLASVLAVFLTPALVWLLAGAELEYTGAQFWAQVLTIAWTVAIPLLLGLSFRAFTPRARRVYDRVGPALAAVAIVAICCFVIQANRSRFDTLTGLVVLGVIVLNALGFVGGWGAASLFRLDRSRRVTLSIEVGMQNAGMGTVLATTTLGEGREAVAIPTALFTIWCILSASAIAALFKRRVSREARESVPPPPAPA